MVLDNKIVENLKKTMKAPPKTDKLHIKINLKYYKKIWFLKIKIRLKTFVQSYISRKIHF